MARVLTGPNLGEHLTARQTLLQLMKLTGMLHHTVMLSVPAGFRRRNWFDRTDVKSIRTGL